MGKRPLKYAEKKLTTYKKARKHTEHQVPEETYSDTETCSIDTETARPHFGHICAASTCLPWMCCSRSLLHVKMD